MSPRGSVPISEQVRRAAAGELGERVRDQALLVVERAREWKARSAIRGVDYELARAVEELEWSLQVRSTAGDAG